MNISRLNVSPLNGSELNILRFQLSLLGLLLLVGCNQNRYQPADWRNAQTEQTAANSGADPNQPPASAAIDLDDEFGELSRWLNGSNQGRTASNLPQRGTGASTLPGRTGTGSFLGSTLPLRSAGTLPLRSSSTLPMRSDSTLPLRSGSTLPRRVDPALPLRSGSTLPLRSGSTLPLRSSSPLRTTQPSQSTLPSRSPVASGTSR